MDVVKPDTLDQVKDIEFGCDFVNGECVGMRKRKAGPLKDIGKICCRNCHHYVGYLRVKEDKLPEEYKPYFKPKDGFWQDGVGCTLPKEMRSSRCLIYTCRDSNIADIDRAVLIKLEGEL